MARHSEVLIQGNDVPGLRMIVTVPVDHTWASETARSIYGFGGNTQYIWRKSWDTNQPDPSTAVSVSSGSGIAPAVGILFLIIFGMVVGGGSDTTPTETPQYAPQERVQTYVPPTPTPSYANLSGPCVTDNFEPC
jgi:hypothetical protein